MLYCGSLDCGSNSSAQDIRAMRYFKESVKRLSTHSHHPYVLVAAVSATAMVMFVAWQSLGGWQHELVNDASFSISLRDPRYPCGVISLAVASALLDRPLELEAIRAHLSPDPLGRNTLAEIEDSLRHFGFKTLAARLSWNDLQRIEMPVVMHLSVGHFVVGAGFANDELVVIDSPHDVKSWKRREFNAWEGIGIVVLRNDFELREMEQRLRMK